MHLLAEPLRGQIDWVQRRHGLTPTAASLAVLVTVLGVCGPSRRINDPIGLRSLPPALSVVLYGSPAAYLQAAVETGLDLIRQWMLQRIGPPDKEQLRRVRLRLGELHQECIAKEFQINSSTPGPSTSGDNFGGVLKGNELETLRMTLKDEHTKILRDISDTTFLLRPHLLVDDAALSCLLEPGRLSTDGAVFHASLGGHVVPAWTGANGATKAKLARLLNLAWHGLPDAGDENHHVRPLLSNALVVDAAGARSLQADRALSAAGAIYHLFFVEAAVGPAKLDLAVGCPGEIAKQWIEGLNALLKSRLTGSTIDHHLDDLAIEIFSAFSRELLTGTLASDSEQARRLERVPVLALKLALLIHAISPARADRTIEAKTAEFACAVATAVSTDDLRFTNEGEPSAAASDACEVTALVAKLRLRGPLRWRELLRSRRVQKAEPLEKLLAEALAVGAIRKEGDLYHAVDSNMAS